jgi:hypothetical protein
MAYDGSYRRPDESNQRRRSVSIEGSFYANYAMIRMIPTGKEVLISAAEL